MLSKIFRPVIFSLGVLVLGAGAASAAEYYYTDPCDPCQPVKVVRVADPCDPCDPCKTKRGFRWFGWFRR